MHIRRKAAVGVIMISDRSLLHDGLFSRIGRFGKAFYVTNIRPRSVSYFQMFSVRYMLFCSILVAIKNRFRIGGEGGEELHFVRLRER